MWFLKWQWVFISLGLSNVFFVLCLIGEYLDYPGLNPGMRWLMISNSNILANLLTMIWMYWVTKILLTTLHIVFVKCPDCFLTTQSHALKFIQHYTYCTNCIWLTWSWKSGSPIRILNEKGCAFTVEILLIRFVWKMLLFWKTAEGSIWRGS